MKTAYLHGSYIRPDGTRDTFWTCQVEVKESPLWHHKRGLSYTATGYGRRIPSPYMVRFNGRWRRVYVCCFSNVGTAYIGRFDSKPGEQIIVRDYQ